MKRRPPQLDKPYPRHRPASPEEVELWRAAAEGVKEHQSEAVPRKERKFKKAAKPVAVKKPKKAPASPGPRAALSLLDKATLAQLKRGGKIKIEARLDLHGHTQATAHAVLVRFLEEAQKRGLRTVLVITGKGKAGQEGILRRELPRWLAEPPLHGRIIAYDSAGPRHGGEGAWYVRLKKGAGF